ncbi:extensin family protein, partial [Methylobacterium sp. WL120]|uniref:extensin-like domain-containing protein n=1 Tax=Methylobacterium sp. WL120 TaxID=2603887 RepID=UPI0011CBF8DC
MWRSVLAFSALALFGAGLTGCAINKFERRDAWRDQAEQVCLAKKLVEPTEFVVPAKEIDGPGPCGMTQPFRVTRLGGGAVILKQKMTLGCPALAEAEAWLADTIQPAATLYFGQPVAEINAGSYACRGRNNQVGAKLSEHSFGNAIDVMSFKLADGYVITVKGGWRGTEAEQGFLREVFLGACQRFTTVLAPGSNVFHYDHIHVDLARHDPRGLKRICQPLIKFTPQLGSDNPRPMSRPRPPERQPAPPQAPV